MHTINFSQLPDWAAALIAVRRCRSVVQASRADGNLSIRPEAIIFDGRRVVGVQSDCI